MTHFLQAPHRCLLRLKPPLLYPLHGEACARLCLPSLVFAPPHAPPPKVDLAAWSTFWAQDLPNRAVALEGLMASGAWQPRAERNKATATSVGALPKKSLRGGGRGPLAGELHLFATLHQALLLDLPPPLQAGGAAPQLRAWYLETLSEPATQRVLRGESAFGPIRPYFTCPKGLRARE